MLAAMYAAASYVPGLHGMASEMVDGKMSIGSTPYGLRFRAPQCHWVQRSSAWGRSLLLLRLAGLMVIFVGDSCMWLGTLKMVDSTGFQYYVRFECP